MGQSGILDGITLQHAGEVLVAERDLRKSRKTHLRSLEDLAFAVCFTDSITSSRQPPLGPAADSGSQLLRVLDAENLVSVIAGDDFGAPAQLLQQSDMSIKVSNRVGDIDRGRVLGAQPYLNDWIARESYLYFGADSSLVEAGQGPGYLFGKSPAYFVNPELQATVPRALVKELAAVVADELQVSGRTSSSFQVHADAINEFVTRNLLTHVVISLWYDDVTVGMGLRIPHVTRALMLHQRGAAQSPESKLRRIQVVVTKHALWDCLHVLDRGETVLSRLLEQRELPDYERIRNLIGALVDEAERGEHRKVDKVYREVERITRATDAPQDRVSLHLPIPGVPIGTSISPVRIRSRVSRTRRAFRPVTSHKDYQEHVTRVLPQLG